MYIRLQCSDAFAKNHELDPFPEDLVLGPFEYVQLTYETVRISPEGEDLLVYHGPHPLGVIAEPCANESCAQCGGGAWKLIEDDSIWSDLVLFEKET